jgi:hypothetical protein
MYQHTEEQEPLASASQELLCRFQLKGDYSMSFLNKMSVQMVGQTSDLPSKDAPCPGSGSWMAQNAHFLKSFV